MSVQQLYALDFDGVICDSAVETAMTGWKAASKIWPDMTTDVPQLLVTRFREVRPLIETGYEAILAMRLLQQGYEKDHIFQHYPSLMAALLQEAAVTVAQLKQLFAETRDHWIAENLSDWIAQNPLFPGIAAYLQQWQGRQAWYIITTKQERFVQQILAAHAISLEPERIYGLDRNMSKVEVLLQMQVQHPEAELIFIEDRLPTLFNVAKHPDLQGVKLQLALWGYNTASDQQAAMEHGIACCSLASFLNT